MGPIISIPAAAIQFSAGAFLPPPKNYPALYLSASELYGSLTVVFFSHFWVLVVGLWAWSLTLLWDLELFLVSWVLLACSSWVFGRLVWLVRVIPVGLCFPSPVAWGVL